MELIPINNEEIAPRKEAVKIKKSWEESREDKINDQEKLPQGFALAQKEQGMINRATENMERLRINNTMAKVIMLSTVLSMPITPAQAENVSVGGINIDGKQYGNQQINSSSVGIRVETHITGNPSTGLKGYTEVNGQRVNIDQNQPLVTINQDGSMIYNLDNGLNAIVTPIIPPQENSWSEPKSPNQEEKTNSNNDIVTGNLSPQEPQPEELEEINQITSANLNTPNPLEDQIEKITNDGNFNVPQQEEFSEEELDKLAERLARKSEAYSGPMKTVSARRPFSQFNNENN